MSRKDREYYLARIDSEREAAERATNEDAWRAHLKLAENYAERVAGSGRSPTSEEPDEE